METVTTQRGDVDRQTSEAWLSPISAHDKLGHAHSEPPSPLCEMEVRMRTRRLEGHVSQSRQCLVLVWPSALHPAWACLARPDISHTGSVLSQAISVSDSKGQCLPGMWQLLPPLHL